MRSKPAAKPSRPRQARAETAGVAPRTASQPAPQIAHAARRGKGLPIDRFVTRRGQTAAEVLDEVALDDPPPCEDLRRRRRSGLQDGRRRGPRGAGRSSPPPTSPSRSIFARPACPAPGAAPKRVSARHAGQARRAHAADRRRRARRLLRHRRRRRERSRAGIDPLLGQPDREGAFNSPVWFNCGLFHEYKIVGSGGNYAVDLQTGSAYVTSDGYTRPQVSACFIQSCADDHDSIFNLIHDEARVFKYGSGSGTNFSKLRGKMERLSGGGTSSGLISFLEVLDKAAGATKSGGITRRAAKMVVLDADHPEIRDFITWKAREEKKVGALIAAGYSSDFNGEAYKTVAGQNANNSVRVTDAFIAAVTKNGVWETRARTTGEVVERLSAHDLWNELAEAAWKCADPGLQFDDTINRWHTCKQTDRIYASNPCSEFVFLDDTACNLASINLLKFLDADGQFDVEGFRHACRVFFLAQEIAVDLASYPTKRIAERSHQYRTLGLGYANLGTLLMVQGLPYDSDEGRALASALTAVMTGEAYALSAEMAASKGPFAGFAENRDLDAGSHEDAPDGDCATDRSRSGACWRSSPPRTRSPGRAPSRSARCTATAMRRPPCSRPPAPSVC